VLRNNMRIGGVPDKRLTVQELVAHGEGWVSVVVELDVSPDDDSCLVAVNDRTGDQAVVVDARPAQTLRLLGLYTLAFEFENTTEHLSGVAHTGAPGCRVTVHRGPVTSAVLRVVVLPRLEPRRAHATLTRVHCEDETERGTSA
jgi:hypothetical protein